jgi:amino acid adenylation domain-containing protein/non-ribosomal peptide synthase protein (TIGR01720 family)
MTEETLNTCRLSPLQERLWLLRRRAGRGAFRTFCVVRLRGEYEDERVAEALARVVSRREILRTAFKPDDSRTPLQVIGAAPRFAFERRDLVALGAEARAEEVDRLVRAAPAEDADGPASRAQLLTLAHGERLLLWSVPALCADAEGLSQLLKELAASYDALSDGGEPPPPPGLEFADVAEWQHELLESEETRAGVEYWRQKLVDAPATRLPFGRAVGAEVEFEPRSQALAVDPELMTRAGQLFGGGREALEAFLLVCWCALLRRHAEQESVVVGVRRGGRNFEGVAEVVGLLARYLPVEVGRRDGGPLRESVPRLAARLSEAGRKQQLFSWGAADEAGAAVPFFPAAFAFEERPEEFATSRGRLIVEQLDSCIDRFALELAATLRGGRCSLVLRYDGACFDVEEVECLASQFVTLLADAVGRPDARADELKLLGEAERQRVLVTFNEASRAEPPPPLLLHQLFERQAKLTPHAPALVYAGRRATYAELNARATSLALHLRGLGAGPDEVVGVCSDDGLEMVAGILGILKAGAAYLALDPQYTGARLDYMIGDSRAAAVVVPRRLGAGLNARGTRLVETGEVWGEARARGEGGAAPRAQSDATLAYLIYTSGSTGRPKGVAVTHANALHSTWARFEFYREPVSAFLLLSPFAFDSSVAGIFWTLSQGGALVVPPADARTDLHALDALIAEHEVTHLLTLPSVYGQLLEYGDPRSLALLKTVIVAGEACPKEIVTRHRSALPRAGIYNEYGPTEASVWSTVFDGRQELRLPRVPIGRPIPRSRAYVLDGASEPVPVGVPGELHVAGPGLARGYHRHPAATALAFVPDPFSGEPGARLYRTGDRVSLLPDGQLDFLGRADRQVKVRGFRIELGEIEAALEGHPAVGACAVIAHEWKPGEKRLAAFVVARRGVEAASEDDLRDFLRHKLPEYMLPPVIIRLGGLPSNDNGKVDHRALAALAAQHSVSQASAAPPLTAVERVLADIWKDVLQLDSVDVNDDFMALGGDSILALQVVARANRAGLKLTARQLFKHPTIAALAAAAPAGGARPPLAAEQGPVAGPAPLTPIQRWYLDADPPDPEHFNQSLVLELHERPDEELLREVTRRLLEHHDALRLRFARRADGWEQSCAPPDQAVPFDSFDLSSLPEAERGPALRSALESCARGFDLERGPVARVALFERGDGGPPLLLVAVHHLAVDGVSWRILLEDFQTLYRGLKRGGQVELPPKTVSFLDWARHLHERRAKLTGGEADWWLARPWQRARPLPVELHAGYNTEESAETVAVEFDADETQALLGDVTAACGASVEEVLLAAAARGVASWAGGPVLLFELEHHGRAALQDEGDFSRTVGWFTSAFPVLLEVPEAATQAECVGSVSQQLRGVPRHGVGYGLLRYDLDAAAARRFADLPRAELRFNYLGRFDNLIPTDGPLRPSTEPPPAARSPRAPRTVLFECNALVVGGRLLCEWRYSLNRHRRATAEALARQFAAAVRALLRECAARGARGLAPEGARASAPGREELERLAAEFGEFEDVYALAPLQEGILFHSLLSPEAGIYFQQISCRVRGALDARAFRRAWAEVTRLHPALRTRFAWNGLERPLQVVVPEAELSLAEYDWSALPPDERQSRLADFLGRDLDLGCDLSRGPLFRLALFRLGEQTFQLVLSHHHLMMDGWSTAILLKQVFGCYDRLSRGEVPRLEASRPYREFIDWLARQDMTRAEAFWRESLSGFTEPTLPAHASFAPDERGGYGERERSLSREATAELEGFARRHGLTLNTLVQGVWALALCARSGRYDVAFGVTVAGRPAELAGVESMIGLFINALPLRVLVEPEAPLPDWLKRLQGRMAELREFEYSPLPLVQEWSEVEPGVPLFGSVVVFENYPFDLSLDSPGGGLRIDQVRSLEKNDRPLTLMAVPGPELLLQISYRREHFGDEEIERLLGGLWRRRGDRYSEVRTAETARRRKVEMSHIGG